MTSPLPSILALVAVASGCGIDADYGGTRYRWSDTGLDADELRERARPYQERYGVPSEPTV